MATATAWQGWKERLLRWRPTARRSALLQARERDAAEAAEKVAERQRELAEAHAEGKGADKIAEREAKLAEARDELRRAREALDR
ncbi:DUF1090 family protein [Thauera sp. SDU_THAU2]|uniref:DUF1090 family protein n=1 Tax=Thauera sp. SDU_THAU2 TaxID=3136633 RepID=UPI004054D885